MQTLFLSVMINNVYIYVSKPSKERKVTTIRKIYDLNSSCHFNYFPFFLFHSIFHSLEIFSHPTKMFTKNWLHTHEMLATEKTCYDFSPTWGYRTNE